MRSSGKSVVQGKDIRGRVHGNFAEEEGEIKKERREKGRDHPPLRLRSPQMSMFCAKLHLGYA